ncbi:MAG: membrane-bound lytic murein transglycosylase MltF [Methylophilus sp.]|nr:membrane-bound lytic murein transglycosylase MltF [Methylophilus sp.]
MRLIKLLAALVLLTLFACSKEAPPASPTDTPKANDKIIRFVTINSASTYYINGSNEYAGLEYDLAKLFVQELGHEYQVKFIVVDSFSKVLPTLMAGQADIAAADISVTDERKKIVHFSDPYQDVQQQVVYNSNKTDAPRNLKALEGQLISIPKGTSFAERLRNLNKEQARLKWIELENTSSEQLLEALANEDINYTIADSHLLAIMQNYYPNLGVGFSIGSPEKTAWALSKNADPKLLAQINLFFKKIKQDGTLRNIIDRYHGNSKRLKPFDISTFLTRTQTLLPKYVRLFKNAQDITDIDWRLLAAVSYQESHWDTYNTSPTNVRGLMMLTEETSDMMNVTDRLDPKQSITAGAKYLLWLKERFPDRIPEPDRTYIALAAYNSGIAHIEDARVLAQKLKLNPDSWADVKTALVKLNNAEYYVDTKHGYCNCGVAVIYTESIRSYYKILEKNLPGYSPELEPYKIAATNANQENPTLLAALGF